MAVRITPTVVDRYNHLETQVSEVAMALKSFIADTKDHRERLDRDQSQIWQAIRDQGVQMREAIEKLSLRGEIRWPAIVTTVSLIVLLATSASAVLYTLSESRIKQLEIAASAEQRVGTAQRETIASHVDYLHELGRENHQSIRDIMEKELHENQTKP
ncbi:MAG: hypothetical protein WCS43_11875 [Verrucomicrobiota bacterium]